MLQIINKLKTALSLCLSIASIAGFSQNNTEPCGTMQNLYHYLDVNNIDKSDFFNSDTEIVSNNNQSINQVGEIFTIPVVFHVVYNEEFANIQNISDEQLLSGLEILSNDFRKMNADTIDIVAAFQSIAADCEIDFCLANVDPYGFPTTGIVRVPTTVDSEDFNSDGYNLIKFSDSGGSDAWNTAEYLNIWIGNLRPGLLGYGQFPNSGSPDTDGIVVDYANFGSAQYLTSGQDSRTVSHEVGHWLNLRHIWGDEFEADDSSCSQSDQVNDTPNCGGPHFGCQLTKTTCNSLDNIQNHMDYSACEAMFTQGQAERMREQFLPGEERNSLIQSSKCIDLIEADIWMNSIAYPNAFVDVCHPNFSPVFQFINNGSQTVNTILFEFLIDNVAVGTHLWTGTSEYADQLTITANEITNVALGNHILQVNVLEVNNSQDVVTGNNVVAQNFTIVAITGENLPLKDDFEDGSNIIDNQKWSLNNVDNNNTTFKITQDVSHFGYKCLYIDNFENDNIGEIDEIRSIDLNLNSFTEPKLRFFYAYVQKESDGIDEFNVLISNDCEITFDTLYSKIGSDLTTAPNQSFSEFVPANSQWEFVTLDLDAYGNDELTNIHFQFKSGLGNNFYIDDIDIKGAQSNTVDVTDYLIHNSDLQLIPNPTKNLVRIVNQNNEQIDAVKIYNEAGKLCASYIKITDQTLNIESLEVGIYFVQLISKDKSIMKKLVKI